MQVFCVGVTAAVLWRAIGWRRRLICNRNDPGLLLTQGAGRTTENIGYQA